MCSIHKTINNSATETLSYSKKLNDNKNEPD